VGAVPGVVAGQRHLLHRLVGAQDLLAQRKGQGGGDRLDPHGHGVPPTAMPQLARQGVPGSRAMRSRPLRNASGGQVIGSRANDFLRLPGGLMVSPVKAIR
jgi:hypothetical protein